jgi:hypothetical protein
MDRSVSSSSSSTYSNSSSGYYGSSSNPSGSVSGRSSSSSSSSASSSRGVVASSSPTECVRCRRFAKDIDPVYLLCECNVYICIDCVRYQISRQPSLWNDGIKCPLCAEVFPFSEEECNKANEEITASFKELLDYCVASEDYDNVPIIGTDKEQIAFITKVLRTSDQFARCIQNMHTQGTNEAAIRLWFARINSYRNQPNSICTPSNSKSLPVELRDFYSLPLGPLESVTVMNGKINHVERTCPICASSFLTDSVHSVATQCGCLSSACSSCARNMVAELPRTFYALIEPGYKCPCCRGAMARWGNIPPAVDLENRLIESAWNWSGLSHKANFFQYAYKGLASCGELLQKIFDKMRAESIIRVSFGISVSDFKLSTMEEKRLIIARAELRRLMSEQFDPQSSVSSLLDEDMNRLPVGPILLLSFPKRVMYDNALRESSEFNDYVTNQLRSNTQTAAVELEKQLEEREQDILRALKSLGLINAGTSSRHSKYSVLVPGLGCLCPVCEPKPCLPTNPDRNPMTLKFADFRSHMFEHHRDYEFDQSIFHATSITQCFHCRKLYSTQHCDGCSEIRKQEKLKAALDEAALYSFYSDAMIRCYVIDSYQIRNSKDILLPLDKARVSAGVVHGMLQPRAASTIAKRVSISFNRWTVNGRHYATQQLNDRFQGIVLISNATKEHPWTSYYKLRNSDNVYADFIRPIAEFSEGFVTFCRLFDYVVSENDYPYPAVNARLRFEVMLEMLPRVLMHHLSNTAGLKRFKESLDFVVSKESVFYQTMSKVTTNTALSVVNRMLAAANNTTISVNMGNLAPSAPDSCSAGGSRAHVADQVPTIITGGRGADQVVSRQADGQPQLETGAGSTEFTDNDEGDVLLVSDLMEILPTGAVSSKPEEASRTSRGVDIGSSASSAVSAHSSFRSSTQLTMAQRPSEIRGTRGWQQHQLMESARGVTNPVQSRRVSSDFAAPVNQNTSRLLANATNGSGSTTVNLTQLAARMRAGNGNELDRETNQRSFPQTDLKKGSAVDQTSTEELQGQLHEPARNHLISVTDPALGVLGDQSPQIRAIKPSDHANPALASASLGQQEIMPMAPSLQSNPEPSWTQVGRHNDLLPAAPLLSAQPGSSSSAKGDEAFCATAQETVTGTPLAQSVSSPERADVDDQQIRAADNQADEEPECAATGGKSVSETEAQGERRTYELMGRPGVGKKKTVRFNPSPTQPRDRGPVPKFTEITPRSYTPSISASLLEPVAQATSSTATPAVSLLPHAQQINEPVQGKVVGATFQSLEDSSVRHSHYTPPSASRTVTPSPPPRPQPPPPPPLPAQPPLPSNIPLPLQASPPRGMRYTPPPLYQPPPPGSYFNEVYYDPFSAGDSRDDEPISGHLGNGQGGCNRDRASGVYSAVDDPSVRHSDSFQAAVATSSDMDISQVQWGDLPSIIQPEYEQDRLLVDNYDDDEDEEANEDGHVLHQGQLQREEDAEKEDGEDDESFAPLDLGPSELDIVESRIEEAERLFPEKIVTEPVHASSREHLRAVEESDKITTKFLRHIKFERFKHYTLWFEILDILQPEQKVVDENRGELHLNIRIYYCDCVAQDKYRSCFLSMPRIKNKLGALKSMIHFKFGFELGRSVSVRSMFLCS